MYDIQPRVCNHVRVGDKRTVAVDNLRRSETFAYVFTNRLNFHNVIQTLIINVSCGMLPFAATRSLLSQSLKGKSSIWINSILGSIPLLFFSIQCGQIVATVKIFKVVYTKCVLGI